MLRIWYSICLFQFRTVSDVFKKIKKTCRAQCDTQRRAGSHLCLTCSRVNDKDERWKATHKRESTCQQRRNISASIALRLVLSNKGVCLEKIQVSEIFLWFVSQVDSSQRFTMHNSRFHWNFWWCYVKVTCPIALKCMCRFYFLYF